MRSALVKITVFVVSLLPAGYLAWGALADRLGADPMNELEVQTGLWTIRFLAVTLAITPLRQLFGWGALAKYRRMFGLFTFFYACVHLALWAFVDWRLDWAAMWDEIVKHRYILVGMLTFLLLLPLAITSTKGWVRRLGGQRWAKLHRLVYVAAITGTVHYLWAVKKDTFYPLVYLLTFASLLGYRVFAQRRARERRAAAAAARS